MNLSRLKPVLMAASSFTQTSKQVSEKRPALDDFISSRNFVGAITLLEFMRSTRIKQYEDVPIQPWLGYCNFHLGEYQKAMDIYKEILRDPAASPEFHLYLACCLLYMGLYREAQQEAMLGPVCPLQYRILFNIAHKFNDDAQLIKCHKELDIDNPKCPIENQLCFAAVYFLRNHFEEASDTYKRLVLEHPEMLALNVYMAFCYFKLDYYDLSMEMLNNYLQVHPRSAVAVNLKACNQYKLFTNGKTAEQEYRALSDSDGITEAERALIEHNKVVFRSGEGALQVLPPLVDVIPEARLNLVIYHLRNEDIQDAYALIKDFPPSTPQEFILKAVVNTFVGQVSVSEEHLKQAQHYFNLVGSSTTECDTIPGRQAMASCLFLLKHFDEVLIYLRSIKAFYFADDTFNYNYGLALAATSQYKEAEETLLLVQNERILKDICYLSWLARCFVMNHRPQAAWEKYLAMDPQSPENFGFLQLIANDCYTTNQYYYAAKAFDVLERIDPHPDYLDGKRGACVGVFQQYITGRMGALDKSIQQQQVAEAAQMLRTSQHPTCEKAMMTIRKWILENQGWDVLTARTDQTVA
ncbi:putative Intraflagellar transport protein 56 [Paratrimastix pyriformis]|uniref:Intraflagellar transport protein 56 n=1 Tax=Paratrimastix pyriformis TaxID=342808 RepID=A0ABQ8URU3_9EUKA|nr:putative Intraflagellar transport protein 56 [Paratrimastix pyriformis]